jgi:serine/threonine protein kinase
MSIDSSAHEPGRVGPYRLVQQLGEGGMGVVHLALAPDGKAVAIKVLRAHIAADPDARLRLAREVATLRRVRHPRVAAVIDADVDGEIPYLVTTFVPGKPLDAHVRDHGPLPRGHVARIGSVLAEALRAIHQSGIVHRDVKPANVMLLDGDPILIDFGIAHVADESRITHTGLVMGTPGYLSPEIIGGEPVTAATDWWGWGATLAFAATGRPPFGTGPIEVVLDRVRRGKSDIEGVDAGLRATLTAALTVDPLRRPSPDRLVAGLAAVAPNRSAPRKTSANGRTVVLQPDGEAVTTVTPPPNRLQEAGTVRTPPPNPVREAATARTPPPSAAGEAVTSVVPPPFAWSSPALPDTRRFDPPSNPGGPPSADPRNGRPSAPANGFTGRSATPRPVAGPADQQPPASSRPASPPWEHADPVIQITGDDGTESVVTHTGDPTRGVLLGLLLALAAVAGVAPYGATWIAALGMVVARVIHRTNTALLIRRDQRGPRGSDALLTLMALPWRLITAGVATMVWLILPILIGISVAFIAASVVNGAAIRPGTPGPLAAGMVALLLTAWFGPGGQGLRHGAGKAVRFAVPGNRARIVIWSLLALVVVSALVVARGGSSPDWGPLTGKSLIEQLSL